MFDPSLTRALIPNNAITTLLIGAVAPLLGFLVYIIYNLYFSPLRIYPGPKLAAATPFPFIIAIVTGQFNFWSHRLHEKYGDVVRTSPIHVSYCSKTAWRDIYERRQGHAFLEKEPHFFIHPGKNPGKGVPGIVTVSNGMHGRFRRLLSHAFSEKALRDQESLVNAQVDLMIDCLKSSAISGKEVDIVNMYNWVLFDIIGDLTFGESFDCLKNEQNHPWITAMFAIGKLPVFFSTAVFIPGLAQVLFALIPASLKSDFAEIFDFSANQVHKRMARQTSRPDFMTRILEHNSNDAKGMSTPEIESSANHIIAGGAESTASALSGGTYYLLKNKHALDMLVNEIRQAFKSEEEITLTRVTELPLLTATINEIMRLYPPFPVGFPRVVPRGGEIIDGKYVPYGTVVSVNHYSTYHVERNFRDPFGFHPERFMGDGRFESDNKQAFQPFSVGPRNCIGKNLAWFEMRLILARVLYNFDLELPKSSDTWIEGQEHYGIIAKPPLPIRLKQVASAS